jgi:hypothetical protein
LATQFYIMQCNHTSIEKQPEKCWKISTLQRPVEVLSDSQLWLDQSLCCSCLPFTDDTCRCYLVNAAAEPVNFSYRLTVIQELCDMQIRSGWQSNLFLMISAATSTIVVISMAFLNASQQSLATKRNQTHRQMPSNDVDAAMCACRCHLSWWGLHCIGAQRAGKIEYHLDT